MSRPVILLAVACCLLPAVASRAQTWEESPFHRPGFYAGVGGTYAYDQGLQNYLEDSFERITNTWNTRRGLDCTVDTDGDGDVDIGDCYSVDTRAPIKNYNVFSGDAVGLNARLGYRFRPWFAAELQVEYVPAMTTTAQIVNKGLGDIGGTPVTQVGVIETMTSTHEMTTAMMNARVFLPLGRIQPYMLGGAGFIYSQTTGDFATYCSLATECKPAGFEVKAGPPGEPPATVAVLYPIDVGSGALESGLDFGFRAGGGIDFYLNEHLVLNWEATAVIPTGKLDTLNYYSFGWGIEYRF